MGNLCHGQLQQQLRKITNLDYSLPSNNQIYHKVHNNSIRFGHIQKIKTNHFNTYKLVLPIDRSLLHIVSIQCLILNSYSDLLLQTKTQYHFLDLKQAPIIDTFDSSDAQVYHKVQSQSDQHYYTLKIYEIPNQKHFILKQAIYQIYLYQSLTAHQNPLKNYFIVNRGTSMSIAMIFQSYECTLFDILLYRKTSNFPWSMNELLYLSYGLLKEYRSLLLKGIVHRDIRLSKIMFKPNRHGHTYRLMSNLQSAYKINMNSIDNDDDLYTVKGVQFFTEQPLKTYFSTQQSMGRYNPILHDKINLAKVILSLIHLNPYNDKLSCQGQLNQICKLLMQPTNNWQQIIRNMNRLMKQNNLLSNNNSLNIQQLLLIHDYDICRSISTEILCKTHSQRINQSYINALMLLHQKDIFVPKLLQQINEQQKAQLKLPLLKKIADYYHNIGVHNNEYYDELILLMIQIAVSLRENGNDEQHKKYIQNASQIEQKINIKNTKTPTFIILCKQKAYVMLYQKNIKEANRRIIETAIQAENQIQLNVSIQLQIIQAKGIIQMQQGDIEEAQEYFEKGLEINNIEKERQLWTDWLRNKAMFEYWMGQSCVQTMSKDRSELKARKVGKANMYINNAIQAYDKIPCEMISTVKCLVSLGDLQFLKQNYQQASLLFERSITLIRSTQTQISLNIYLKVLKKLGKAYDKTNKQACHQVYRLIKELQKGSEKNYDYLKKFVRSDSKINPLEMNEIREQDQDEF